MTIPEDSSIAGQNAMLVDENEQLRALLESALEEGTSLAEDRDRLRDRIERLGTERRSNRATMSRQEERSDWLEPAFARQSATEEELRVAFEELQVLTEELEVANSGLQKTNEELDARVDQRTLQLKEINVVLRATEASLRTVADLVPELLWRADPQGDTDWCNQRWLRHTGQPSTISLGMGWFDAIHPADRDAARADWDTAIERGSAFEHEHRLRDANDAYRWFLVRAKPLRGDKGKVLHWFASATDIHDQRLALEALQQSESRFRTLVEGMPQLVWRSLDCGRWTWSSPQWSDYTGQSDAEALGHGWLDTVHDDDRATARDAWGHAAQSGALEIEARIFHAAEQRHRHFRIRALPLRDATGRIVEWLGTSTDVDDILQLQEEQGVLVAELQHRTRNLMGVVQAVTSRTLRGAASLDQFGESIDDRFSALARVQTLLSQRETGARVPFDLLLREELSAHIDLDNDAADKVRLDGPEGIPLRSLTVQTFALALHELATNAVKYGALSPRGGMLSVTWRIGHDDKSGRHLWVDWRETGVSGLRDPGHAPGSGYGRELIERALPYQLGARTSYAITPDGVHCTIDVTVSDDQFAMEKTDD